MATLASFAKYVRPNVSGCPELLILDAIRRACIDFCERTKVTRERVEFDTVAGQAAYTLATTAAVVADEVVAVEREGADDLIPSSFDEFNKDQVASNSGTPNWFYLDETGDLVLGYTPDAIETLTAVVKVKPSETAAIVPDVLYDNHVYAIGHGASALLMMMKDQPWTDLNQAGISSSVFNNAIDKANLSTAKGGSRKPLRVVAHSF